MKLEVFNESANTSTSGHFSDIEFMTNSFKNEPYSSQSDLETKFKSNRKSIYDNHRMSLFKDDSCDSSELEYSSNFQDHEIKNKNSQKIDRDDFDDLIDLTHRVPRKFMKKTQNIKKIPKPSSLPPLPPLPYSFVKLERSKADSNLCLKIDDNKKSRKSVTRLIMPIQSKPNESSTQKKFEPDKIRQSDVIQEWDQISKIFASLETLLNDVVQTSTIKTCNDSVNSIKTGSENFQRGKSSQSHRAMSEHNLKKCDQMNSISFNSINRSNTNKTKYLKKLLNDSFGKNDEVDSCQIGKSSFHLNMKKFKYFELSEYLGKLNLSKYEFKFLTNGYDDLAFLNNVLTLQDLIQIGIEDYNDIFTILNEVKKLPSKIRRIANENIQFNSVSEWLNYLNLNEYLSNFTDNNVINMEMAKSLWEIELSTIIQIPLIGHRKRIVNSIKSMIKNEDLTISSPRHEASTQDETDIELIDEEHLFKTNKKQKKQKNYKNFKPDELIYSSSSNSSKSSESASPPLSYSSRQCTSSANSEMSSKSIFQEQKIEKIYSNSLLDLNQSYVKTSNRGEAVRKRNSSLENSIYTTPESSRSNKCPKTIWKNDPQNLIKGSFNFGVNYLGSSAITKMKNNEDPVKATIDRLKNTSKNTPYPLPKIELAVSINGVKLLNVKTKETLFNYDIKHINNVCQDQDDLKYFAFSTQSDPSAHYYCHVFSCKDKDLSTQVILTIGQAFDIAFELFCKNNFN